MLVVYIHLSGECTEFALPWSGGNGGARATTVTYPYPSPGCSTGSTTLVHTGVRALDATSMAFSQINLPTHVDPSQPLLAFSSFRVVYGAGRGPASPPTAWIVHANGDGLEVFRRVIHGGGGGGEWVLEHVVPRLSEVARGMPSYLAERPFRWVADGVGLAVVSAAVEFDRRRKWFFTVDVDAMEVQFVPESSYHLYRGTTATSTHALPYMM